MDTSVLFTQFSMLPDNLKQEAADFIAFLSQKSKPKGRKEPKSLDNAQLTTVAMAISEKVLQEDWANEDNAHWERFLKE